MRLIALVASCLLTVAPATASAAQAGSAKDGNVGTENISTTLGRYGQWELELDGHIQIAMRHVQALGALIADYQQQRDPVRGRALLNERVVGMLADIDRANLAIAAMPLPDVSALELPPHLQPQASLASARDLLTNVRSMVAQYPQTVADMHSPDAARSAQANVRILESSQLVMQVLIRSEQSAMIEDEEGSIEFHNSMLFLGYLRSTNRLIDGLILYHRGEIDRALADELGTLAADIDANILGLTEAVRRNKAEEEAAETADLARLQATMNRIDLLFLDITGTYREFAALLRGMAATARRSPSSFTALLPQMSQVQGLRQRIEANRQRQYELFAELAD